MSPTEPSAPPPPSDVPPIGPGWVLAGKDLGLRMCEEESDG